MQNICKNEHKISENIALKYSQNRAKKMGIANSCATPIG